MQWTAEQLTAFLDGRRSRIAGIVAPMPVAAALADIHERVWKLLPRVPDMKSLENLTDIAAADIPLRPAYMEFLAEHPEEELVKELFASIGPQLRRTIGIHLRSQDAMKAVLADVNLELWKSRATFDPERGWFIPWARRIALNKARAYRPFDPLTVSLESGNDRPLDVPSSGPSPEDIALAGERASDPDGPPSETYVEILRLVQEFEPHEAIAFLFNRYLQFKPERIALGIGELPLPDALAEVARITRILHPEIVGIDTLLAPLAGRIQARTEKFREFVPDDSSIEKAIGRWAATVHRAVRGTILQMGKRFLRLVCDLSAAAHEVVVFLWIQFLQSPPVALRHVADRDLMCLVDAFHTDYAQRELLSLHQVESSTVPLRHRIDAGRSLNDFAGADLYSSIKRWCAHVRLLIEAPAAAEHMLGYAYITGSLMKGKSR